MRIVYVCKRTLKKIKRVFNAIHCQGNIHLELRVPIIKAIACMHNAISHLSFYYQCHLSFPRENFLTKYRWNAMNALTKQREIKCMTTDTREQHKIGESAKMKYITNNWYISNNNILQLRSEFHWNRLPKMNMKRMSEHKGAPILYLLIQNVLMSFSSIQCLQWTHFVFHIRK